MNDFSKFWARNRAACEDILGAVEWGEIPSAAGEPHGRAACKYRGEAGELHHHSSGVYKSGDLKIFIDCHPSQIGVYCWHESCDRSLAYATAIRAVAMGGNKLPPLPRPPITKEDVQRARSDAARELKQAQAGYLRRQKLSENLDSIALNQLRLEGAEFSSMDPTQQCLHHLQIFPPETIIWIGEPGHSGQGGIYAPRWMSRLSWQQAIYANLGKFPGWHPGGFTTPSEYPEGTSTRSKETATRRFFVMECDEGTPELQARIILHLRDEIGLDLVAVIHSGGRSLHAWWAMRGKLTTPALENACRFLTGARLRVLPKATRDALPSSAKTWGGLGGCPSTLRACQPVRLAGVERRKQEGRKLRGTGVLQRLIYLNPDHLQP